MPTAWGEAVDIIITAALIFPEPLPDPPRRFESLPESPSPSSAFDQALSRAEQHQRAVLDRPLFNNADLPAPLPGAEDEGWP